MGLFTPKWNHKDAAVREKAFKKLSTAKDYYKVALKATYSDVANLAFEKIETDDDFSMLVKDAKLKEIRLKALRSISDPIYLNSILMLVNDAQALEIILNINDKEKLNAVISEELSDSVFEQLIERVDDPDMLEKIAQKCKNFEFSPNILEKIKYDKSLKAIAASSINPETRALAIKKIKDDPFLLYIIYNEKKWYVRHAAIQQVTNQTIFYKMFLDFNWVHESEDINLFAILCKKITDVDILNKIHDQYAGSEEFEELKKTISHSPEIVALLDNFVYNKKKTQTIENIVGNAGRFYDIAKALYSKDQNELATIINESDDFTIREYACQTISDEALITPIALNHEDPHVRSQLISKIKSNDTLNKIIETDTQNTNRWLAVGRVTDEKILENLAKTHSDDQVRYQALDKIKNQGMIVEIAKNNDESYIRTNAVSKIDDTDILFQLLKDEEDEEVILEILDNIADINELNKMKDTLPNFTKKAIDILPLNDIDKMDVLPTLEKEKLKIWTITKINDSNKILTFLKTIENSEFIEKVCSKLEDASLLITLYKQGILSNIPGYLYGEIITDDKIIKEIMTISKDPFERESWISRISNKNLLQEMILNDESGIVQSAGLECLSEPEEIVEILSHEKLKTLGSIDQFLTKITDEKLLDRLESQINNQYFKVKIKSWRKAYNEFKNAETMPSESEIMETNAPKVSLDKLTQNELNLIATLKSESIVAATHQNAVLISPDFSDFQKKVLNKLNQQGIETLISCQKSLQTITRLASEKKYKEAINEYTQSRDLIDWNYVAQKSIGSSYYYLNDFDNASAYMEQAYQLNKMDQAVMNNLVEIQGKMYS